MHTPAFFADVAPIVVDDPLAAMLGAADGGRLEYHYIDAVKLAGHSCPTVAGAWLMTRKALATLYPDSVPQRGGVRVEMRQAIGDGVTGVIANVIGLVTGAAAEGGFKGLAGRYGRQNLLRFGVTMTGEVRFTRLDTGAAIELVHQPQVVPRPAGLTELLRDALGPGADPSAAVPFGKAWQAWVRTLLVDHADDPALIVAVA